MWHISLCNQSPGNSFETLDTFCTIIENLSGCSYIVLKICYVTSLKNNLLLLYQARFDGSYKYHSAEEHSMNAGAGVKRVLVVPDRSPSPQRRAQQHSDGALRLTQRRGDVFIVKHRGWEKDWNGKTTELKQSQKSWITVEENQNLKYLTFAFPGKEQICFV